MPEKKLKEFLDNHHIKYRSIKHPPAYTAQEIAATAHIPGKKIAKTVMIKVNGTMAMAVLPAQDLIDFKALKQSVQANKIELAAEDEFKSFFPECEVGAMPPFGNLYGMDVYVSERLAEDEEIAFNAGSHRELIMLAYRDFNDLVKPRHIKM